jgi:hypothetical protein
MSASPSSTATIPSAEVPLPARTRADGVGEDDAAAHLAASRQRLRQALFAIAHPPPQPSLFADGISNVGNRLLDRVKSLPMATALLEGLDSWWQRHPLHRAANAADAASKQLLGPLARRKPGTVILIAVGAGILLAYGRPWRWLLRPSALFGAITEIGRCMLRGPSAKAWRKAFKQGVSPPKEAQSA